jgi:hypothetical protein
MCGCPAPAGPGSRVTRRESQTGINAALDFSGSLTMGALGDRRNRAPLLSCGRGFFFFASAGSPATRAAAPRAPVVSVAKTLTHRRSRSRGALTHGIPVLPLRNTREENVVGLIRFAGDLY